MGPESVDFRILDKEKPGQERPAFTIYLIRHAESAKDKSNPNRALTELGQDQVIEAVEEVIKQLIREEKPEFTDFDDENAWFKAWREISPRINFRLYDSGTDRTLQQVAIERNYLLQMGAENIYTPESVRKYLIEHPEVSLGDPEGSGPGVQDRLEGIRGVDQDATGFRQKLKDVDFKKAAGIPEDFDEIQTWAAMPDEEIPENVEKLQVMVDRVQKNLAKVENVAPQIASHLSDGQRIVVIANSHASNTTVTTAFELGRSVQEVGEIENAEGVRMDFYSSGAEHTASPFGHNIEAKIQSL